MAYLFSNMNVLGWRNNTGDLDLDLYTKISHNMPIFHTSALFHAESKSYLYQKRRKGQRDGLFIFLTVNFGTFMFQYHD